jgi:hypothetical protein
MENREGNHYGGFYGDTLRGYYVNKQSVFTNECKMETNKQTNKQRPSDLEKTAQCCSNYEDRAMDKQERRK